MLFLCRFEFTLLRCVTTLFADRIEDPGIVEIGEKDHLFVSHTMTEAPPKPSTIYHKRLVSQAVCIYRLCMTVLNVYETSNSFPSVTRWHKYTTVVKGLYF